MGNNQLLFSVTKKDLDIQYFRSGGPGGQAQNKKSTGVRIIHRASGAVGESREHRSQEANRKAAFHRMVESKVFQNWIKITAAAKAKGFQDIEEQVDKEMRESNIKTETFDVEKNSWVAAESQGK